MLLQLIAIPKGAFRREILENSGFSQAENPILFGVLFEYKMLIVAIGSTLIFLFFMIDLKKETLRYQLSQFCYSFIIALFATTTAWSISYTSYYGRYWYFFPVFCIGWNDASAYFCGRAFGRTKLIQLSPKKTVEGFVGALISNTVAAIFFVDYWLDGGNSNFWTCAPMRITVKPFEDYQCM